MHGANDIPHPFRVQSPPSRCSLGALTWPNFAVDEASEAPEPPVVPRVLNTRVGRPRGRAVPAAGSAAEALWPPLSPAPAAAGLVVEAARKLLTRCPSSVAADDVSWVLTCRSAGFAAEERPRAGPPPGGVPTPLLPLLLGERSWACGERGNPQGIRFDGDWSQKEKTER